MFENPDDSKSMAIQKTNLQVGTVFFAMNVALLSLNCRVAPLPSFPVLPLQLPANHLHHIRLYQVVNITSPANFFHVLRRQIHRDFRKPLVVMTPKSLLRHPLARSTYADMATGTRFRSVIHDDEAQLVERSKVKKLLLCSGKVYFDLLERKLRDKRNDVAISRIEQVHSLCAATPGRQSRVVFADLPVPFSRHEGRSRPLSKCADFLGSGVSSMLTARAASALTLSAGGAEESGCVVLR